MPDSTKIDTSPYYFPDDVGYLEDFDMDKPHQGEDEFYGQEVHEWFLEGCYRRFTEDDIPF